MPAQPSARANRPAGPTLLVHEFARPFLGPDGQPYRVRVYGRQRADETWTGWLEFAGSAGLLRTGQETTQSNHGGVAYWASGLEPTYLEGAFSRAHARTRAPARRAAARP